MREDKFEKAILVTGVEKARVGVGWEFYVPSPTAPEGFYTVSLFGHSLHCDCPARSLCYHALASAARPAAVCVWQLRRAASEEEIAAIVEIHRAAIRSLPESVRSEVRREWSKARARLAPPSSLAA